MGKSWFVTGSSRGLGRAFVEAALERGDRVAATARDVGSLRDLERYEDRVLPLALDVTDEAAVAAAVAAAVERFGALDVVVNNAGAGATGAVEEVSVDAFRAVVEVNVFGPLAVIRAVLPQLRAQGHGHVVNITSLGGLVGMPLASSYIASKWALEGLSDSLAQEVAGLGIAVTAVEPSSFATSQGRGQFPDAEPVPAYDALRQGAGHGGPPPGDPADAAAALLRIVDAPNPPTRVVLGQGGVQFLEQAYAARLDGWREAAALA